MNILKNFQQFYEVYGDEESLENLEKEEIKRKIAVKCFEINVKYIQKQLENMKEKISEENRGIYNAVESQIKNILAKYSVY